MGILMTNGIVPRPDHGDRRQGHAHVPGKLLRMDKMEVNDPWLMPTGTG
jgi:hypothetical protein